MTPITGKVYTFLDIIKSMTLSDSPHLNFVNEHGETSCVQTSHLTEDQMLSIQGWAETKWKYLRTTREWIPIFKFVGTWEDIEPLLDITVDTVLHPYRQAMLAGTLDTFIAPCLYGPKGYPFPAYYSFECEDGIWYQVAPGFSRLEVDRDITKRLLELGVIK